MSGKFVTGKDGAIEDVLLNAPAEPTGGTPRVKAPHVNAAFINALAEEGSRDSLILFLQQTWNDYMQEHQRAEKAERELAGLRALIVKIADSGILFGHDLELDAAVCSIADAAMKDEK